MQPSNLIYENNTICAQPAFRIIALLDLPLADLGARQAMAEILNEFLKTAAPHLKLFARSGGKIKALKPEKCSPKVVTKARSMIADAEWSWPTTLRFYGHFDEPHSSVAPPHLRFEQLHEYGCIQIELPADPTFFEKAELIDFSNRIQNILTGLPVLWGVMGFGMYQPVSIDSLIWMLPRVTPRFKCAIEVQPDKAHRLMRRTPHMDELSQNILPVMCLPDIGWRTIVGDTFIDRLPALADLDKNPDLRLSRGDRFTVVEAGLEPIWGDINLSENISPYIKVAQALKPYKPSWIQVRNGLFGGYENDNGLERIKLWYQRFDSIES